jgi:hypothetical protein
MPLVWKIWTIRPMSLIHKGTTKRKLIYAKKLRKFKAKDIQTQKIRKSKATTSSLIAHTSLRVSSKEDCIFIVNVQNTCLIKRHILKR